MAIFDEETIMTMFGYVNEEDREKWRKLSADTEALRQQRSQRRMGGTLDPVFDMHRESTRADMRGVRARQTSADNGDEEVVEVTRKRSYRKYVSDDDRMSQDEMEL